MVLSYMNEVCFLADQYGYEVVASAQSGWVVFLCHPETGEKLLEVFCDNNGYDALKGYLAKKGKA